MLNIKGKFFFVALIAGILAVSGCIKENPADMLDNAVRNNNAVQVKKLLDKGVPVEPKRKSWTPLMIAVIRNRPKIADLLLTYGANIHAKTIRGQTPLHLASRWGKTRMVKYLLKKGAGAEKRDWLSWTPIMWASLMGKKDTVKTLIDWGANINVRDLDYNTPLILAVWRGHTDTALLLIKYNASLYAINNDGLDAAAVAQKHEFYELAKKLESLKK